jgi:hypothetical protein
VTLGGGEAGICGLAPSCLRGESPEDLRCCGQNGRKRNHFIGISGINKRHGEGSCGVDSVSRSCHLCLPRQMEEQLSSRVGGGMAGKLKLADGQSRVELKFFAMASWPYPDRSAASDFPQTPVSMSDVQRFVPETCLPTSAGTRPSSRLTNAARSGQPTGRARVIDEN